MTALQPPETFRKSLNFLVAVWPLILLTPLIPFPSPSLLVGHPWKPELFLSFLMVAILTVLIFKHRNGVSFTEIKPISISMVVFVIWSGFSILWAESPISVLHHTFVWAGYLIFIAVLSDLIPDRRFFKKNIYVLGVVTLITSANCVIEYVLREQVDQTFGFRYGRFSEVWAALIPLFIAVSLRSNGVKMTLSTAVTVLMWLGVLFSTSRTSLAAAVGGVCIFMVLVFFNKRARSQITKLGFVVGLLLCFGVLSQLPIVTGNSEQKGTTFDRLAITRDLDAANSLSDNIRFLFAAVGIEMLLQNPVLGVGADNYGIEFNKYRAAVSARAENSSLVVGNEDAIPERTHNEYLQVAAELGVIGAAIFAAFLLAILWLSFKSLKESANIYKLAAVAGMAAFLFSSLFSSFSFRLVQNGVVFFFLTALLTARRSAKPIANKRYLVGALLACICLAVISSLRAANQYMTYRGEVSGETETSMSDLSIAERLDSSNAAANYIAALKLLNNARYGEAAAQFQAAIDKGVGTSATYSYLISAHSLNGNDQAALDSAAKAVEVFPYSVFLLTRYSVLLEKSGRSTEAQAQFAIARSIDARQAETWKIFITQGARTAAEQGRKGVGVPLMADLYPQDGLYAMLAERQILYPQERYTNRFGQ